MLKNASNVNPAPCDVSKINVEIDHLPRIRLLKSLAELVAAKHDTRVDGYCSQKWAMSEIPPFGQSSLPA